MAMIAHFMLKDITYSYYTAKTLMKNKRNGQ